MNYDVILLRLDCFRLDTVYLSPFALSCIELSPFLLSLFIGSLSQADYKEFSFIFFKARRGDILDRTFIYVLACFPPVFYRLDIHSP